MQLLSKKVTIDNITIEISVHDLSFRMGFRDGETPKDHMYVRLTARDASNVQLWETPFLADNGKIRAYSSVQEALSDVTRELAAKESDLLKKGLPHIRYHQHPPLNAG